jgi:lipid A disaccharide synthetase
VRSFDRVYAVDAKNAREIEALGFAAERVERVGNLAVDGALGEAAGAFGTSAAGSELPPGTILVMPGTRRHEIASGVPFFVQMAVRLARPPAGSRRGVRDLAVHERRRTFARARWRRSPQRLGCARTRRTARPVAAVGLLPESGGPPFPIVRDAMRTRRRARLVVTLPGTKCIELAALGVPTIVCVPLNAPEVVVINGPLQYLDRVAARGNVLETRDGRRGRLRASR